MGRYDKHNWPVTADYMANGLKLAIAAPRFTKNVTEIREIGKGLPVIRPNVGNYWNKPHAVGAGVH